ncbi:MAG TPA: hypothetical protein DIT99_04000 [Candidatus Latescibacteria bacterium]|nr:hypothetical protein [Candidatus Latescibacterota bacterium]
MIGVFIFEDRLNILWSQSVHMRQNPGAEEIYETVHACLYAVVVMPNRVVQPRRGFQRHRRLAAHHNRRRHPLRRWKSRCHPPAATQFEADGRRRLRPVIRSDRGDGHVRRWLPVGSFRYFKERS